MKFIGKRLEVYWSDNLKIVFEKRTDNDLQKEKGKNSKLFNLYDFDGETIKKEIKSVEQPNGQSANEIIQYDEYWLTAEEFNEIERKK